MNRRKVLIGDRLAGTSADNPCQETAGRIVIQGSEIQSVEPCQKKAYPTAKTKWLLEDPDLTDVSGRLLSPSFINAHTHIAMSMFRGLNCGPAARGNMIEDLFFHLESRLRPEDVLAFSRMGAWENLFSGNGLVWDHYYHGEAVAKALEETGLCGVVAPTLQDLAGPGKEACEKQWEATLAIHSSENYRQKGILAAFGPHATDTVSDRLWSRIAEHADISKLPVHSHHSQSPEEFERCQARHRCSPTVRLDRLGMFDRRIPHLLVHNIYCHKSELNIFLKPGITLGFCPFSSQVFGIPSPVMEWEKAGIPWTAGTDCVASNDSMNLQKELRYIAGIPAQSAGFSIEYKAFFQGEQARALQADASRKQTWTDYPGFRAPGQLLQRVYTVPGHMHPGLKVGRIAKGYLANMIVWDTEHPSFWPCQGASNLSMGDTTGAILHMLCAGKWIGEYGNFHQSLRNSGLYQDHLQEANRRFQELLKRARLRPR